jgi:hypothetical protein
MTTSDNVISKNYKYFILKDGKILAPKLEEHPMVLLCKHENKMLWQRPSRPKTAEEAYVPSKYYLVEINKSDRMNVVVKEAVKPGSNWKVIRKEMILRCKKKDD